MITIEEVLKKAATNPKASKARVTILCQMIAEITMSKEEGQRVLSEFQKLIGETQTPPVVRPLNPNSRAAVWNEVEANTKATADCPTCGSNKTKYAATQEESEEPQTSEQVETIAFDLTFYLDEVATSDEFTNKDIAAYLNTRGYKIELPSRGFLPKSTLIKNIKKQYLNDK